MIEEPAIRISKLSKRFGKVAALDSLDLSVPAGSVFGFLGPNGAGKTTTIRVLLALVRASKGQAFILGQPIQPGAPILSQVGALVERPAFYPYLSASENLLLFAAARGLSDTSARAAGVRALDRVGLTSVAQRRVGGFSTGMRQRLGIGLALLSDPLVVILDEPTTGLDPEGTVEVRGLIRELAAAGATVFLSTHVLAEAEQVCSQVAVIDRGHLLASGPTPELLAGRGQIIIRFREGTNLDAASAALAHSGISAVQAGDLALTLEDEVDGASAVKALGLVGIYPAEVQLLRQSLEEVYLKLTREAPGT